MFKRLGNAWKMLGESVVFLAYNPKFIFPILLCWVIYASSTLYLYFEFDFSVYSLESQLLIVFLYIISFSMLITISSLIILELLEQKETKGKCSLLIAIKDAFTKDLYKTLPVVIVWSILLLIITLIELIIAALTKGKNRGDSKAYSAEAAAEFFSGGEFSLSGVFFDILKKGIRMVVLLILPAIAWEDMGTREATKKGMRVFKHRITEMVSGVVLTHLVSIITFLPVSIMFYLNNKLEITFSETTWYGVILYIGFAWSYSLLIEQLFTAELYLWNMKWEKAYNEALTTDNDKPKLSDIPKPSFLDRVPDLLM